eukprot:scaffold187098_cov20-Prasinocladus_malaysianus.AAC.1
MLNDPKQRSPAMCAKDVYITYLKLCNNNRVIAHHRNGRKRSLRQTTNARHLGLATVTCTVLPLTSGHRCAGGIAQMMHDAAAV